MRSLYFLLFIMFFITHNLFSQQVIADEQKKYSFSCFSAFAGRLYTGPGLYTPAIDSSLNGIFTSINRFAGYRKKNFDPSIEFGLELKRNFNKIFSGISIEYQSYALHYIGDTIVMKKYETEYPVSKKDIVEYSINKNLFLLSFFLAYQLNKISIRFGIKKSFLYAPTINYFKKNGSSYSENYNLAFEEYRDVSMVNFLYYLEFDFKYNKRVSPYFKFNFENSYNYLLSIGLRLRIL